MNLKYLQDLSFNLETPFSIFSQRVIFNIVNVHKAKNCFRDGLTPLVKSSLRTKWQRIPKEHVFWYKSPAHQGHYVLSFAFCFDKEDEIYQFALGFPYSYSKLQSYLQVRIYGCKFFKNQHQKQKL